MRDRAYAILDDLITQQRLPPGTFLSEASLAEKLGLGRTPIREALQRLALEGLVTVLPRRGHVVAEIEIRKQLKVLEVRAELERLVVRHAARLASQAQRQEMHSLARGIRDVAAAGDTVAFMSVLRECHEVTAEAADNEILGDMIRRVHGLSRRFWFAHVERYGSLTKAADLHGDRLHAMAAGDSEAAAAASDNLVAYLEAFTRDTLGAAPSHAGTDARR